MSLLLEALKKAEKAKEEAQRRAQAEAKPGAELRLQDDVPAEAPRHVVTRSELPDISQSLEILSDDIATPAPAASPAAATAARSGAAPSQSAERAAARKTFEAKYKEPNPRLPFYITMGVLGVAVVGAIGYFWYQLRPAPGLVNRNPPITAPVVAAAPASRPPAAQAASLPIEKAPIPGLPDPSIVAQDPKAPTDSPLSAATVAPAASAPEAPAKAVRRPVRRARAAPPAAAPRPTRQSPITRPSVAAARPAPQVNPLVQSAYEAYATGDMARARAGYEDALHADPHNRDALLGLAAADIRLGRFEAAEAAYLRLLRADPGDALAEAGLISLRAGRMDPLATESRLKTLLAAEPEAHVLNFTLGNQLAQQGRWPEAERQYSQAFAAAPENADFAYNLAVSLDHLHRTQLALQYYRRALALAERHGASFDAAAARQRVAQLGP